MRSSSPRKGPLSSDAIATVPDSPMSTENSDGAVTPTRQQENATCSVVIPSLSSSQKAIYHSVTERDVQSDEECGQDGAERILGDLNISGNSYFYVRYKDGVVYGVPARAFRRRFPNLVHEYKESQAMGNLAPFDPSSSDIHPSYRQAVPTLNMSKLMSRSAQFNSSPETGDSDHYQEAEYEDSSFLSARRSTRSAAAQANKRLRFSGNNRTGRNSITAHNSESDGKGQEVQEPTRKSDRVRKLLRSNLDDEDFEDNTPENDISDAPVLPKKRVARGKASRPAYGHFRVVADLELDEEENEGIAPLLAHRTICEKCQTMPTHRQANQRGRKRKAKDDASEDEETRLANLGGWIRCLRCPVAAHWGCLAKTQRDEILRAAHERDKAEWRETNCSLPEPVRRFGLDSYQTTEFICGSCMKGGICMGCRDVALKPDEFAQFVQSDAHPAHDVSATNSGRASAEPNVPKERSASEGSQKELLFRCITCKRLAHYAHLPVPDELDPDSTTLVDLAKYYQDSTGWKCADCFSYIYSVEHILAWRPYPENAVQPSLNSDEPSSYKSMLPREYLIKWVDRSYRRLQWVSHGWLRAVAPARLKNFLLGGSRVPLLPEPTSEERASVVEEGKTVGFDIGDVDSERLGGMDKEKISPLIALPDAEKRIPPAWQTVDRILDIRLWKPKAKKRIRKSRAVSSEEEIDADNDPNLAKMRDAAHDLGDEPPSDETVPLEQFESLTQEQLSVDHASQVAWAFIKWDDLGYDEACWDSPPRSDERFYTAYLKALERFISARQVQVPLRRPAVPKDGGRKRGFTSADQPSLGQSGQLKLMDFQVAGVNWLCQNWMKGQNCILADEMGLGKTVQIVTFIGYIVSEFNGFPALVVVPNSTITNWVREFERWAPRLRVVPFYGEAKARDIIKKFELFHPSQKKGFTGAKYHVLITTYETVINPKEFGAVFKRTPSWEILVVDEGQRLKSDSSLIFRRLKELQSQQRIIMTGTPLNNNIRELFNLMNFLDPDKWADIEELSKQFEELTDELVADLHMRLKPYFLRRIKSEVLHLPPKNEVIVPVTMAPLQKEIYRSILSQNLEMLRNLTESNTSSSKGIVSKTNMNNMLMQLRKCVQHPYLVSPDIEPKGLSPAETHERLIGASAKLRLLKMMLPPLQARGHRVLIFSQFKIALDIVEDFLVGEHVKYLRLDGDTKQSKRQKDMDTFNKKDSDIFVYLLTTRAGGVGINLWSADTVIIFDPDFNPHQDLQAIARAHRYGQQKTVLVFKLMVKDSAEERIMQTGKRKLVLDHLIVQKMDDEDGSREDVQSILLFGAKALFEDSEEAVAREVHYSEHDIHNLIERTEKEGDQVEPESGGSLFSFAKVWSASKEGMEELAGETAEQEDAWSKALELIATRTAIEKEKEQTGRGVRRKAAAVFPQQDINLEDSPPKTALNKEKGKGKRKSKGRSVGSDDSDFHAPVSEATSDSDGPDAAVMDIVDLHAPPVQDLDPTKSTKHGHLRLTRPPHNQQVALGLSEDLCGLCGNWHASGHCSMTESPENLAAYRLMLLSYAGEETVEERRAAIRVIDETLHRLGKIHLIYGQPLHLVETTPQPATSHPPKKAKFDSALQPARQAQFTTQPLDRPNHTQFAAGLSRLQSLVPDTASPATAAQGARPVPLAHNGVNAVANSSKESRSGKAKLIGGQSCAVCGHVPYHLVKDCPVVAQGPLKINEAIQRLALDPSQRPLVEDLRSITAKHQRSSLAASATSSGTIIDLTDS